MTTLRTDQRQQVFSLKPNWYMHVLDNNTNVTHLKIGPDTITLQGHEEVIKPPTPMIIVRPRHYCVIRNPVVWRNKDAREPETDSHGQVKLRHGDTEIRFEQEPFPLYPGEDLDVEIKPLTVVQRDTALLLRAIRDFKEGDTEHRAGDEWLFRGPGTYTPRVEVIEVRTIPARVLTDKVALHMRAKYAFTDAFGKKRRAGDEWLVTLQDTDAYIPDVYEEFVREVPVTTLDERQWCMVRDPIDEDGKPRLGTKEVRKGERGGKTFFLYPGESLERSPEGQDIRDIYVLAEDEALLLRARESFEDEVNGAKVSRKPGDYWMIRGPMDYIPSTEIEVVERRHTIPLDKTEGIYVRDLKTGEVRLVCGGAGQSYMLKASEELAEKDLPSDVEELLGKDVVADRGLYADMSWPRNAGEMADVVRKGATLALSENVRRQGSKQASQGVIDPRTGRDKTRAITYRVPQNAVCQVFDFKQGRARKIFGPDLVMLDADEQFTLLSLSGGKPKQANKIKALALLLGPDFMTDDLLVETSDHARLKLRLSYNWYFDVSKDSPEEEQVKLFAVPDFVGDACKQIASRVRGEIAKMNFDEFHRNSARVIRKAVFGEDASGHIRDEFRFKANNLVITNIDIQSVEPEDSETRESLKKAAQIGIKISTDAQEAEAREKAETRAQSAQAALEQQKLEDQKNAEKRRKEVIERQSENARLEAKGRAAAQTEAEIEANRLKGESELELADKLEQAARIRHDAEMERLRARQEAEIGHQKSVNKLETDRAKELARIATREFKDKVEAITPDVLKAMAEAGPALQARLLQGLGIHSMIITDGKNPLNLIQTANGLIPLPTAADTSER